jgi:hypothetical protein
MRPTSADAAARKLVRLTHRGWTAELIFVEAARQRGKVRLRRGAVVWVPLDQLEVCAEAPHVPDERSPDVHHHRQAG